MKTIAICTIIAGSIAAFQVTDLVKQNYIKAEQVKAERVLALQLRISERRNTVRIMATGRYLLPANEESDALLAKGKAETERDIANDQAQIDAIQGFAGTPQPYFPNTKLARLADEAEARDRQNQPSSDGSNHP